MKKFLKYALLAIVVFIFIGTFIFLYKKSRPDVAAYETYKADIRNIEKSSVLTGTIEPRDEVLIKPQISGIISELYKHAGEPVSVGEIIAKVKVIPDMSSLNSATNRVSLAKINYGQAKTDFERMQKLMADKLVSKEDFEKSRQAYLQAKEEVGSSADALQIVKEGISKNNAGYSTTLIRSTINGTILDVPVKVGNSVIMSNAFNDGTTIATVADMKKLIFKGYVDETEVSLIHTGMPVKITIGAMQDKSFDATLEYIAPKVSSGTSSANQFEIKAAVSIPQGIPIRAGYSANANIILQTLKGVLTIPEGSVEYNGDSTFVYKLIKKQPQEFKRIPVQVGLSDGINILVKQGLKKGDEVRGNLIQKTNDNKSE